MSAVQATSLPSTVPRMETIASPDPRRWMALALLAIADFVGVLDATIVNIALPSIGRHLHASNSDLSVDARRAPR